MPVNPEKASPERQPQPGIAIKRAIKILVSMVASIDDGNKLVILEGGEQANVADLALFVERRNRLGPGAFAISA
jgi:hypothetical protein